MIQIGTRLKVCDNTGAKIAECFRILGASWIRFARIGDVIVVAIKEAAASGTVKEHEVAYAVIVRQKKEIRRKDGSYIRFDDNAAVILTAKDSKEIKGSRIFGPVARELRRKKFMKIVSLSPEVL